MGKLTTYIIVMSGLMLLFYFTGLLDNTANSTFLDLILNPESIRTSSLDLQIALVLEGVIATALVVGFAIAGNIELGVMGVFAIFLSNLLWDFLRVFDKVATSSPELAILLFSPLMLLYGLTILEWWRGRD
mgnify:CR=1 FL=1